jgi:hypothetical protein
MPTVSIEAMNQHSAEISQCVCVSAIALLILDGAGWHGSPRPVVPDNIVLLPLPPYKFLMPARCRPRRRSADAEWAIGAPGVACTVAENWPHSLARELERGQPIKTRRPRHHAVRSRVSLVSVSSCCAWTVNESSCIGLDKMSGWNLIRF